MSEYIVLNKAAFKAALHVAPKADIRYYLNGILLEVASNGDVHYVATDGHRLLVMRTPAIRIAKSDTGFFPGFTIIVPRETVELALKASGKVNVLSLETMDNGMYALGNVTFRPVDGKFPDWRRVLPASLPEVETVAQYNPEYVLSGVKALRDWTGRSKLSPHLYQNGTMSGSMVADDAHYVVMPMRNDATDRNSLPAFAPAYVEPKEETSLELAQDTD